MRVLLLFGLLSFSFGMQGATAANAASIANAIAAAQKYSNSAQAKISTGEVQLENDLANISMLVGSAEQALCGLNSTTGLAVDSSGNYTNCAGGVMNDYNLWAADVNYWAPIINGLTNSDSWHTAYEACAQSYNSRTGFFNNMKADQTETTAMQNGINFVIGKFQQAANELNSMNNAIDSLSSDIDATKVTAMAKAINTNWALLGAHYAVGDTLPDGTTATVAVSLPANSAMAQYTTCWSNALAKGARCSDKPCAIELQNYFNAFEATVSSIMALFTELLSYTPYETGTFYMSPQNAPVVACILPSKCDMSSGTCQYSIPNFSFDINDGLTAITAYVTQINDLTQKYTPLANALVNRLSALGKQLGSLGKNIPTVISQVNTTIDQCNSDITKYIEQVEEAHEIFDLVIGTLLGAAAIMLGGAVGGMAVEILLQVLLTVPQINNNTIGYVTNVISEQLATVSVDDWDSNHS